VRSVVRRGDPARCPQPGGTPWVRLNIMTARLGYLAMRPV
jgi:hypothetical protein